MDLLFFAGPVVVRTSWDVNWFGRDVRVVPVVGAGSDTFRALAATLRDRDGRILPQLCERYARVSCDSVGKIALSSYSAGWGLLDAVADVDADRKRIEGMALLDSVFDAGNPQTGESPSGPKSGYRKLALDAAQGTKFLVATTANTSPGTFLSGRQSWLKVWDSVPARGVRVVPKPPAPAASGGWHQKGAALWWGDYSQPGASLNQGQDYTHQQHHDLAPLIWQAYVARWLNQPNYALITPIWTLLSLASTAWLTPKFERYLSR
jgi:hypothetical protein